MSLRSTQRTSDSTKAIQNEITVTTERQDQLLCEDRTNKRHFRPPTTRQDVALLSKFPASGQPTLAYPDERESYDSDQDPGGETDTGLSKVLRVDLDVGGGTVFTVLVLHLKSQIGDYKADQQRAARHSAAMRGLPPCL